jgi:rod shape-determining protein MreC
LQNFDDFWDGLSHASDLKRNNRRLQDLADSAAMYQETVDQLRDKIDRLRHMVELPKLPGRARIAADVIMYWPHENRLTLSVGRDKGIEPNLPVITPDGLVGVIQTVEESRCQVTLITSPTIVVGAMAQRDPPQPGLLKGQTPTRLLLEFVDTQSPLEVGDKVVTSGHSETIPGGIPIGKIIKVENDADFGSRRAQIFPNVKVGELREVFILK